MSHRKTSRRRFGTLALGGALGAPLVRPRSAQAAAPSPYIIPPRDAEELTSACAFCIVGCGYRIFRWPLDAPSGGHAAADNALGVDLPAPQAYAPWISPSQHNVVLVDGRPHHVVVLPDYRAEVVNPGGDHTLGGVLARRLYSAEDEAKQDRLLRPRLRVGDRWYDITWDEATELVAETSRHVIDTHGELAWGMKTYSYQFYENTYAITKLAFEAVGTPCWAPHDQPRTGSSTPGLSVAGVDAFSGSYQDWRDADVVFLSGVAVYEARGVLFSNWVSARPDRDALVDEDGRPTKVLVVANPRRDVAAQWAIDSGGVHLQLRPGTDCVLNNAIARLILEREWQDDDFLAQYVVDEGELRDEQSEHSLREAYGMTFAQWRDMIMNDPAYALSEAEAITGVPAADIERAAELLAKPRLDDTGSVRPPRTSLMLEKGNYWSHNFPNSASLVSLGLVLGAGNRAGRVISRGGGHQRGMLRAAPYPMERSPHTLEGRAAGLNLDAWVLEGNLRLAWVIGCTWAGGGTAAAGPLYARIAQLTRESQPQLQLDVAFPNGPDGGLDVKAVQATLQARADAGGMVLIQQDIYPHSLTELADIVLPAASWGEEPFTRMQGERRLRYYAQICDPPGEARPDWKIVADIATRMGYDGFEWMSGDDIFEEAADVSGGTQAYGALVELAQRQGRPARRVLEDHGTTGLQCPLRLDGDQLQQTERYHDADTASSTDGERGAFGTRSGKALFARGSWADVLPRQELLAPRPGELWVINRRDSRTWSAMIEDRRIRPRMDQMSDNVLEVNPTDAERLGLDSGRRVRVRCHAVSDPAFAAVRGLDGVFEAVVEVSDRLQTGVTCAYFNYFGEVTSAANNTVSNTTDPINGMYSFKLGRGVLEPLD